MKKFLLVFSLLSMQLLLAAPGDPCRLNTSALLPSGGNGLMMENGHIRLLIEPNRGATCLSFIQKSTGNNYTTTANSVRMFSDRIMELSWQSLLNVPFAWKVIKNTPDELSVMFSKEGLPQYQYLAIHRTITIKRNSSTVLVKESFYNDPAGMAPVVITPYFRHGLSIPGKPTNFYTPDATGIKINNNQRGGGDLFYRNPPSGFGAISDGKGNGLAFSFDFRYLNYIYNWMSCLDHSSLEWIFVPVKIQTGKSFTTNYSITAFRGIDTPEGAKNGIVGSWKKGKLSLFSDTAKAGYIKINGKKWKNVKLAAGKTTVFNTGSIKGSTATFEFVSKGKTIFKFSVPLKKGAKLPLESKKISAAEHIVKELVLSRSFVTPHIPWATPHVNGKLKLLILCDYQQQREAVELAQRLECDFKVIRISHISSQMSWGMVEQFGSFTFKDANIALRHALKNQFDCIVVSGNLWKFIERDNLKNIRTKLEKGAGLVMIQPYDVPESMRDLLLLRTAKRSSKLQGEWLGSDHPVANGFAPELTQPGKHCNSELLPGAQSIISSVNGPVIAAGTPKSIRVIQTAYFAAGALLPILPLDAELPDYNCLDYQFVPVIKSILWAAGRLPAATVKAQYSKDRVSFTVNGLKDPDSAVLQVTLRNLLNGSSSVKMLKLDKKCSVSLPVSPAPGINTAEYRLLKDGKTIDFGFAAFEPEAPIKLLSVKTNKELYNCNEKISGKAEFTGKPDSVKVELFDALDRLLARGTTDSSGKFAITLPECSTKRMVLKVTAEKAGVIQAVKNHVIYAKVFYQVPDYAISGSEHEWMWDVNRKLRPYFFKELRRQTGYDLMRLWTVLSKERGYHAFIDYMRFDFPLNVSILGGIRLYNFASRFQKPYNETGDRKYLKRVPCFHDPSYIKKRLKTVQQTLRMLKNYSPEQFSFGDELSLTHFGREHDFCFTDHSIKAYRKHLKETYKTLAALNKQWGSNYKSWNAIVPPTTAEAVKAGKKTGNYSAWTDFRDFMDNTFSKVFADTAKIARDAGWKTPIMDLSGVDSGNAYNGKQWYRMSKTLKQVAPYISSDVGEQIRSFFSGRVIPWNAGYNYSGGVVEYRIWLDAFMYKNGGSSFYSSRNTLYPDYTLQPGTRDWANATHDLRKGLGAVRATLDEEPFEVLILASHRSMYAASILRKYTAMREARLGWTQLMIDLDLKFRFIADQELEAGLLKNTTARVVILPFSRALSANSCKELREFVRKGGILIADRLPAIMDERSKTLKTGQLNDLFGLTRPDKEGSYADIVQISGKSCMRQVGYARGKNNSKTAIRNTYGKGSTVYLNYTFSSYASRRNNYAKEKEELLAMQQQFLEFIKGRQHKSYTFKAEGGTPVGARIFSYRQKGAPDALFFGLSRENKAQGNSRITMQFPRAGYLYDLRKGTVSRNKVKSCTIELAPAKSVFMALLPEKLNAPRLTAPEEITAGKEFRYSIVVPGTKLEHAFEITVTAPDGSFKRLYSKVTRAPEGRFTGKFLTALNDQKGEWLLTVRDAMTNKKVQRKFRVK